MIGLIILGSLILVAVGLIWLLASDKPILDDILRERVDYDVWLRRNTISEEKERDLEHKSKMNDLKEEIHKLENLLKK